MAVKLQPMADRLVVRPIEREEVTKGGIYIPDTVKEKPQEGEVLAVGPGRLSEDGKRIAMEVKVGDRVLYTRYGGTEIKIDDEEVIILRESAASSTPRCSAGSAAAPAASGSRTREAAC